jgi:hypothetical protein
MTPTALNLQVCKDLAQTLVFLAEAFLWAALIVALLGAIADIAVKLWALLHKPASSDKANLVADPGAFITALKGLIDSLANAPAWIAMFLGGVALIWAAGSLAPAICK